MKKKVNVYSPSTARFWPALGFATLAGMRSMSSPALLSHFLSRHPSWHLITSPLRLLQKPIVASGMKLLAGAEMVADKLPIMPNRTDPSILLGRLLSGALVGATWYKSRNGSSVAGAAVGGLGAVAATFLSYALRKGISAQSGTHIAAVGVGEDALVMSSGAALLKAVR
jgi:uncharacterized membrane protein